MEYKAQIQMAFGEKKRLKCVTGSGLQRFSGNICFQVILINFKPKPSNHEAQERSLNKYILKPN